MPGNVALVVAAGRSQRLGGETPKQYLPLGGRPMVRRSLAAFVAHDGIDAVAAVIHPRHRELYEAAAAGLDLLPPVPGGATRRESVLRGLEGLEERAPERVLIHDAARPFVDETIISRVLAALDEAPGAIAAVPVVDTLKRGADGRIEATVERSGLWRAQTPQGFRFADILQVHRDAWEADAETEFTDDAAVAERAGLPVVLVMGSEDNLKVTTEEDLRRARRLAEAGAGEVRTGLGFDVHRFAAGDHLWLCGVRLPHSQGLAGHSDADVGLHALTDALLGAIAAGDIGAHFPPGDPKWRDAPSEVFLRHAGGLVAARGGAIVNLDLTLICEAPKIGPHREAMIARIAEILGLPEDRVSVKATTTEKMGFAGRGEGLAAQAVATVRLPAPP
jgi:2-C-methyl-D-erythritol 4-phosphate cytidylyltransferase/2-C-methyl-D-erythritol 2,4-cyclodiphosphate synthase